MAARAGSDCSEERRLGKWKAGPLSWERGTADSLQIAPRTKSRRVVSQDAVGRFSDGQIADRARRSDLRRHGPSCRSGVSHIRFSVYT